MSEISPIEKSREFYNREGSSARPLPSGLRPTDSKIHSAVRPRIKASKGSLLGATTLPIIDFNPESEHKKERKKSAKKKGGKYVPIGLRHSEEMGLFNSILQLILFLPGFQELFSFAPRSFQPFSKFIEQYLVDQNEQRSICSFNPKELFPCIANKLPPISSSLEIEEFIFSLSRAAFPKLGSLLKGSTSIALHPEWHMHWDVSLPFSFIADQHLAREGKHPLRPPEFFVSPKNRSETIECQLVQRQYFTKHDALCYDLDAFIECRPDGANHGHYVAYLKIDGIWYQCDEEKVISMRSTNLNLPLHQSVFLHYRKVDLLKPLWR